MVNKMEAKKIKRGFMLAEMAIVIVIIAIITSMMIFASGFLDSGKNQAIIFETTTIRQNISKFYNMYKALPGDIDKANTTINTNAINGNGNGKYDVSGSYHESLLAWQHLVQSGIIIGSFTDDVQDNSIYSASKVSVNIPQSKTYKDGGYRIGSYVPGELSGSPNYPQNLYNIFLEFAIYSTQNRENGRGYIGIISPANLQDIDTKMDDGKPLEGYIIGLNDGNVKCNSGTSIPGTESYTANLVYTAETTNSCIMFMILSEYV